MSKLKSVKYVVRPLFRCNMLSYKKKDQTLLWTCVAGAHLQCVNNHYAKLNIKEWKLLELQIIQRLHNVRFPKVVKTYYCIDTYSYSCLNPLSNERKSMFKSGDSRAVWTWVWTWKYLKWALHYLHDVILYRKRWGPDCSFRRCFCSRKHCVRLWRCDDVMMFESLQPAPFCLKKSSVR